MTFPSSATFPGTSTFPGASSESKDNMALNDDAVFTAAMGYIFHAVPGTATPTVAQVNDFDPEDIDGNFGLAAAWKNLGHTSREDLPEFGFDGGETEPRGTWQNQVFKTVVTEVAVDYVTMNVHQFDDTGLGMYYGTTNGSTEAGRFSVVNAPTNTVQKAVFVVMVDGVYRIGFWAPYADMKREDAISLAVDEFAVLPIRATFVKKTGFPMFDWIGDPESLGAGL